MDKAAQQKGVAEISDAKDWTALAEQNGCVVVVVVVILVVVVVVVVVGVDEVVDDLI